MHHPEQFRMTAKNLQKERLQRAAAERQAGKVTNSGTSLGHSWPVRSFLELSSSLYLVGPWVTRLRKNLTAKSGALWHDIA